MPSPALIMSLPVNKLPNQLALKVPNSEKAFFFVLFINLPNSSRDLTIFTSSLEIINVVIINAVMLMLLILMILKTLLASGFSFLASGC